MKSLPAYTFSHDAMGTTFSLTLFTETREYARQAVQTLFEEIDRLEHELSRFYPVSDISRINSLQAGEQTRVEAGTVELLELAQSLWHETNHVFDITINSEFKDENQALQGCDTFVIDNESFSVAVVREGLRLDLGGIAKGYALDQLLVLLNDWGIEAALLHSGESSVMPFGLPPGKQAWDVALRHPENDTVLMSVSLANQTISGSGSRIRGEHIIDPCTGKPAVVRPAAWAFAPAAAVSDALSTAFMIMTVEEIEQYCRANPETGAILYESVNDTYELRCYGNQNGNSISGKPK